MSRRFVQKNFIPRAQLRQYGVRVSWENELYKWKDSWHESDSLMFTQNALKCCDECNYYFTKGELISKGYRQIYPDAPLPVEGADYVHLKCEDCYKDMELKDILKGKDVSKFGNFATLSREEKIQWLTDANQDISLADDKLPLEGFKFVVTGNFRNKDELLDLIASNGGSVSTAMTKAVTHCLLGATGHTEYGQVTGMGSKKYKEAAKAKCVMVTPEALKVLIESPAVVEDVIEPEVVSSESAVPQEAFVVSRPDPVDEEKDETTATKPVTKGKKGGAKKEVEVKEKEEEKVGEEVEEPAAKRPKRGAATKAVEVVVDTPVVAKRATRGSNKK